MKLEPRKLITFRQLCMVAKEQFSEHGESDWADKVKFRVAQLGYAYSPYDITKSMAAVKRAHHLRFLGE